MSADGSTVIGPAAADTLRCRLQLAKEIQLNMWVRFCLSAAKAAHGRSRDGVHVSTLEAPEELLPTEPMPDERTRLTEAVRGPVNLLPFRFAPSYRHAAALFGITPSTSAVTVTRHELIVHFGPRRLRTARSNIEGAQRSGGFSWPRTAGPAHLSLTDRGITFATNADDAVCVTFREPVPSLEPTGRLRHPGMTVTVADPDLLLSLLAGPTGLTDLNRVRPGAPAGPGSARRPLSPVLAVQRETMRCTRWPQRR